MTAWEHGDYAQHVLAAGSALASRDLPRPGSPRACGARRGHRDADFAALAARGRRRRRDDRRSDERARRGLGHAAARRSGAADRQWLATPRVHLSPVAAVPRPARPASGCSRRSTLPPRGTLLASDGTPLAQGPDRTSPIPDRRRSDRRHARPDPADRCQPVRRRRATRPAPRSASTVSSGSSSTGCRHAGRPAAGRPRVAGQRRAGARHGPCRPRSRPAGARGRRGDGRPVRRDHGHEPPHRGAAGAGRDRLLGAAAARLDDEDHHRHRRAAGGDREAGTTFPIADRRPRSTATRCRTPTARPAAARCSTRSRSRATRCSPRSASSSAAPAWSRSLSASALTSRPRSRARAESTIPSARTIGDELAVGSSAIGQGMVQTTPLEMTDVAATIAMGGRRPIPTLLAHQRPRFVRVISGHVAHEVQQMMVAVVEYGTGTAAADPGRRGRRQDRHGRATTPGQRPNNPNANSAAEHRRLVRRLRAGRASPRSWPARCSPTRVRAAPRPRRRFAEIAGGGARATDAYRQPASATAPTTLGLSVPWVQAASAAGPRSERHVMSAAKVGASTVTGGAEARPRRRADERRDRPPAHPADDRLARGRRPQRRAPGRRRSLPAALGAEASPPAARGRACTVQLPPACTASTRPPARPRRRRRSSARRPRAGG